MYLLKSTLLSRFYFPLCKRSVILSTLFSGTKRKTRKPKVCYFQDAITLDIISVQN